MPLELHTLPSAEYHLYVDLITEAFSATTLSVSFPNGVTQEDARHLIASIEREKEKYPGRAEFFKVVDTDLPQTDPFQRIVGVSQWKLYPRQRSEEEMAKEEEDEKQDHETYGLPPSINVAVSEEFHDTADDYRKKHLGGNPHLLLQVLATRPGQGRRGVGALSMKRGCEQADELGLPAYLEGSANGVGLYKKWGFEIVDELPFDARDHGSEIAHPTVCMVRQPKKTASES